MKRSFYSTYKPNPKYLTKTAIEHKYRQHQRLINYIHYTIRKAYPKQNLRIQITTSSNNIHLHIYTNKPLPYFYKVERQLNHQLNTNIITHHHKEKR